jgi:GT2 family glycosyltransferase
VLLDIILPIFGEWSLAERAIDCLAAACEGITQGYRLIVVDNGSPPWKDNQGREVSAADQAIAVKGRMRPHLDLFLRLDANRGYPGAMNYGASRSTSPLILLTSADVMLNPGSITEMVKTIQRPDVGVVGPMLIFPPDSVHGPGGKVQSAGHAFDITGHVFHIFLGWSPDHPKVNQEREMASITGAVLLTRRSIWADVGGLFEGYGGGTYEDVDFNFNVRSRGFKVVFQPKARGYHYVGGSIREGANPGFNLAVTETTFRSRWMQHVLWDEWMYWRASTPTLTKPLATSAAPA